MNELSNNNRIDVQLLHLQKIQNIQILVHMLKDSILGLKNLASSNTINKESNNLIIIADYTLKNFETIDIFNVNDDLINLDEIRVRKINNTKNKIAKIKKQINNEKEEIKKNMLAFANDIGLEIKNFVEINFHLSNLISNTVPSKLVEYELKFSNLEKKFFEISDIINELQKVKIAKCTNTIDDLINIDIANCNESINDLKQRIDKINNDVSKNELAYYFQTESEKFIKPAEVWLERTINGMIALLVSASLLYFWGYKFESYYDVARCFPFFMTLTWFIWFSSKQYYYNNQLRDEYEYKYALSMSYLSYKKEAVEISDDSKKILPLLLGSVISNIATSPVQAIKKDCHMPFSEMLSSIKDFVPSKPSSE